MQNCRDCISSDVCYKYRNIMSGTKTWDEYFENGMVCDDFKDKSKIIELPVTNGETVYFIDEIIEIQGRKKVHYEVVNEGIVDNMGFDRQTKVYANVCTKDYRWILFYVDDFSKTVFTSKEEAEKALEE